ncbi:hypothetical protein GCM10010238_43950 [Streptomyces griseoviridis]|uniref:Response regulatory domain-containing protein n=1 Tax=Streptomyces griseoviridis TaxID=45398 RepID=A0A918GPE9_STRGD|nr:hypothetical protein GCM10010238_43950 [Streptomyces niveoruber]
MAATSLRPPGGRAARRPVPVTRVLVADDGHLIRAALIELLRTEGDVESVADTGDGRQVLPLARWPVPAGPSPS